MAHFLKKSDGVSIPAIIDPRIVASSRRQSIRQVESLPSFHHEESAIPFRAVQSGVAGYRADERVSTLITHVMWLMEFWSQGPVPPRSLCSLRAVKVGRAGNDTTTTAFAPFAAFL